MKRSEQPSAQKRKQTGLRPGEQTETGQQFGGQVGVKTSQGKGLYGLSVVAFITIYIVNTLGFADTATNSAMGCGKDWPLCNGQIVPSHWNQAVMIEYTHRLSVVFGGVVLLVLAVLAWRRYAKVFAVKGLIVFAVLGVLFEAFLGALAVMFVNPPAIMATHMGFALWTFVGVGLLMLTIRRVERVQRDTAVAACLANPASPGRHGYSDGERDRDESTRGNPSTSEAGYDDAQNRLKQFGRLTLWSIPYAYGAIYVGAYVASTGYGGAFMGWPFPTEHPGQVGIAFWVDVLHRSLALGYLVWMILLVVSSAKLRHTYPQMQRFSIVALVLVCLQAGSGWLLIATKLSAPAFLVHVSIVSFLFATQCYLGLEAIRLGRGVQSMKDTKGRLKRVG